MVTKFSIRVLAPALLISLFIAGIFAAQTTVQAEGAQTALPEDLLPRGAVLLGEVSLDGKLGDALDNLIDAFGEPPEDDPFADFLLAKINDGATVSFALYFENEDPEKPLVYVMIDSTASEYSLLEAAALAEDFVEAEVDGITYLENAYDEVSLAYIDGQLFISNTGGFPYLTSMKTKLSADTHFADFKAQWSDGTGFLFINFEKAMTLAALAGEDDLFSSGYFEYLLYEGFVLHETLNGYDVTTLVKANEETMKAAGLSLTPGGTFVPSLYKKFPNEKTLLYLEMFNFKKAWEESVKMMGDEGAGLNEVTAEMITEDVSVQDVINMLSQEIAYAIQKKDDSPIPTFTFMANAAGNAELAAKIVTAIKSAADANLAASMGRGITYSQVLVGGADAHRYTVSLAEVSPSPDTPALFFDLYFGLTVDNIFFFSTDANFPKAYGLGLGSDFDEAYSDPEASVANIVFFNFRGLWETAEDIIKYVAEQGGATDPEGISQFYHAYTQLYSLKYLFGVSEGGDYMTEGTLTIGTDSSEPPSGLFESMMNDLKGNDSDDDGLTDYEELYVHYTHPNRSDTDYDGIPDGVEIEAGTNPFGAEPVFDDMPDPTWYSKQVIQMEKKGAITGYVDYDYAAAEEANAYREVSGVVFKPNQAVTRCEFLSMLTRGYDIDVPYYVEDFEIPFSDHDSNDWCAPYATRAFELGIITGRADGTFGGHQEIDRASAAAMLARTSARLQRLAMDSETAQTDLPFADVDSAIWYAEPIRTVYAGGIMLGNDDGTFAPTRTLNRAEAAVIIKRSLDADTEVTTQTLQPLGESFEVFTAPLGEKFLLTE